VEPSGAAEVEELGLAAEDGRECPVVRHSSAGEEFGEVPAGDPGADSGPMPPYPGSCRRSQP